MSKDSNTVVKNKLHDPEVGGSKPLASFFGYLASLEQSGNSKSSTSCDIKIYQDTIVRMIPSVHYHKTQGCTIGDDVKRYLIWIPNYAVSRIPGSNAQVGLGDTISF